jgi:glycosyltransferase involved in cell wall biosynthesis
MTDKTFMQLKPPELEDPSSIAILLCTMHGANFLREQIDSIVKQKHKSWTIWASDDGSSDGTLSILDRYQKILGHEKVSIQRGPSLGFVANFLSLTCREDIKAAYYAFSDQDDIWEEDKLARALEYLQTIPKDIPALYCSRTRYVDALNKEIGFSRWHKRPPNFANALVQSIGGGNTMVFNDAACQLLRLAGSQFNVPSHDWWVYMVVSGCGGQVIFDPVATVRYRQHDDNIVGGDTNLIAGYARMKMVGRGRLKSWNDANLTALQSIRNLLTHTNQKLFDEFSTSRSQGTYARLRGLIRSGVHRQTLLGNIGLLTASFFNKL